MSWPHIFSGWFSFIFMSFRNNVKYIRYLTALNRWYTTSNCCETCTEKVFYSEKETWAQIHIQTRIRTRDLWRLKRISCHYISENCHFTAFYLTCSVCSLIPFPSNDLLKFSMLLGYSRYNISLIIKNWKWLIQDGGRLLMNRFISYSIIEYFSRMIITK